MLFGSELNQFSDLTLFAIIVGSIFCGWLGGYFRGVLNGHEYGSSISPILNVSREDMPDGDSIFMNMATDMFIAKGPAEQVIAELSDKFEGKKIVILQIERTNDTV